MKKFFTLFFIILFISACSKSDSQKQDNNSTSTQETNKNISQTIDKNTIFSFDINTLKPSCDNQSQIVCAINVTIKCTINPDFEECEKNKSNMPSFVFMQDESLQRPTSQSYKITKIKPLQDGSIEVYTQSTCNGNWFGLCNGNIIYVLQNKDDAWIVKDLYAVES